MAVNFGKTTKGAGSSNYSSGDLSACRFTSDEATTLCGLLIYCKYVNGDANIKGAVYDSSYNLVTNATTDQQTVSLGQDGWVYLKFSTKPSISASTVYYLAWRNSATITHYYDAGSTNQYISTDPIAYANAWPASITPVQLADWDMSIYALGTPVPSVVDTVTVTDVVTDLIRGNARDISVNDSTSLSEWVVLVVLSISVNDTVTVSESVVVSMPSIAVQEWVKTTLVCKISVNDTVSVSESVSTPFVLSFINVNDAISIAEAVTSFASLGDISVNDAISLAESVSLIDNLAEISVYDAVSILEKVYFEWWQGVTEPTPDWTDIEPDETAWTDLAPAETAWTDL